MIDMKHFNEVENDDESKDYFYSNIASELFDSEVTLMSDSKPIM